MSRLVIRTNYPEGSDSEADEAVRTAAAAAVTRIDGRRRVYEGVETLFFGLSLGSVLVLVAIGLAITFGVMGVINMAHGELMMLGAYTTYVVQTLMPDRIGISVIVAVPALMPYTTPVLFTKAMLSLLEAQLTVLVNVAPLASLGVAVIAGVGTLSDALTASFERQGEVLLGGDATLARPHRRAEPDELPPLQFVPSHDQDRGPRRLGSGAAQQGVEHIGHSARRLELPDRGDQPIRIRQLTRAGVRAGRRSRHPRRSHDSPAA